MTRSLPYATKKARQCATILPCNCCALTSWPRLPASSKSSTAQSLRKDQAALSSSSPQVARSRDRRKIRNIGYADKHAEASPLKYSPGSCFFSKWRRSLVYGRQVLWPTQSCHELVQCCVAIACSVDDWQKKAKLQIEEARDTVYV